MKCQKDISCELLNLYYLQIYSTDTVYSSNIQQYKILCLWELC